MLITYTALFKRSTYQLIAENVPDKSRTDKEVIL
jgi:hypothetical protein